MKKRSLENKISNQQYAIAYIERERKRQIAWGFTEKKPRHFPKARKTHFCDNCRDKVSSGEKYFRFTGRHSRNRYLRYPQSFAFCMTCSDQHPTNEAIEKWLNPDQIEPCIRCSREYIIADANDFVCADCGREKDAERDTRKKAEEEL